MGPFIFEFISASLLMGLAIGIDAALATAVKASSFNSYRQAVFWLLGISLTHTLFPMVGYLSSHYGVKFYPMLSPVIGLLAFLLIAHFLWQELNNAKEIDNQHDKGFLISLGLILAVSWDALWSGPAKSAQVIDWPITAIWGSFFIVGLTVSLLSCSAFFIAKHFIESDPVNPYAFKIAQWVQLSAISYFGLLALCRYTLTWPVPTLFILLMACCSTAICLLSQQRTAKTTSRLSIQA